MYKMFIRFFLMTLKHSDGKTLRQKGVPLRLRQRGPDPTRVSLWTTPRP